MGKINSRINDDQLFPKVLLNTILSIQSSNAFEELINMWKGFILVENSMNIIFPIFSNLKTAPSTNSSDFKYFQLTQLINESNNLKLYLKIIDLYDEKVFTNYYENTDKSVKILKEPFDFYIENFYFYYNNIFIPYIEQIDLGIKLNFQSISFSEVKKLSNLLNNDLIEKNLTFVNQAMNFKLKNALIMRKFYFSNDSFYYFVLEGISGNFSVITISIKDLTQLIRNLVFNRMLITNLIILRNCGLNYDKLIEYNGLLHSNV